VTRDDRPPLPSTWARTGLCWVPATDKAGRQRHAIAAAQKASELTGIHDEDSRPRRGIARRTGRPYDGPFALSRSQAARPAGRIARARRKVKEAKQAVEDADAGVRGRLLV
jgi:hypothetical protein